MDPEDNNIYRPISNLRFQSKVIEKIVAHQMSYSFMPKLQSDYKKDYSAETVLLWLLSYFSDASHSGQVMLLAVLKQCLI